MASKRALLLAPIVLVVEILLASPAQAADSESGHQTCPVGQVVWITERTSAGTTTVVFDRGTHYLAKRDWSTTTIRTGLRETAWTVRTTGEMDHVVTAASCRF